MGYCEIRITPEHFELRDDNGKSIATVKGIKHARLFSKSWEYEQKLKELIPILKAAGGNLALESEAVSKLLKEEPKEVKDGARRSN